MSEKLLKTLLSPRERRVFIQEIKGTTSELTEISHLLEKYLVVLEQIREQQDLSPLLKRLEGIEELLTLILGKVDLTEKAQQILSALELELKKGK